jgi:hypothetical protein
LSQEILSFKKFKIKLKDELSMMKKKPKKETDAPKKERKSKSLKKNLAE